jgi:hypothetical protein
MAEGDLVVTEVRGDADETNGSWVELFNASGGTLELQGLRILFRNQSSGIAENTVIVRRALNVAAGDYIVLGRYFDGAAPSHVDYGVLDDFEGSWPDSISIDVQACAKRVDEARYSALPTDGTYSLGTPPDFESNDISDSWCFDATPTGTPGAANTPCPPPP